MFESLVITLREGVEAALVLAIALALLERRNLRALKPALLAGAFVALLASGVVAWLALRIEWNQELAEGIAELVGAVLVATLVWWMWRAGPGFRAEIESGIGRATGGAGAALGVFLFAFGMVFREGAETAIFLSAARFNSEGLSLWFGALIGLVLAIAFGVLFVRGTIKIPLKTFFSVTSTVLILIAIQLLIGGLHELSEAEILPSSRAEMAIIGPVIKNELLLFTLTVALAAGWLLFGPRARAAAGAPVESGPEARLERATREREGRRRRWTGFIALAVVGLLATAFVQESRLPERPPANPVAFQDGIARVESAPLADGHLHFFEVTLDQAPVRFFAVQVGRDLKVCFDACEICGDKGYFEDKKNVVCRNCTAPIALATIGRTGGCNPIPLPHRVESGAFSIAEADIRAMLPRLKGK
jgi:FTR1 family protein